MKNKQIIKLTLASALFTGAAHAASVESSNNGYLGVSLGHATTDVNNRDLNRLFSDLNLAANSIELDDSDTSYNVFVGYRFTRYFALEAGYLDLGERSLKFAGSTTAPSDFYDKASTVYPLAGDGFNLSLVGIYPITDSLSVSAKLGVFDWQGDYHTHKMDGTQQKRSSSGEDFFYGAEINYQISDDWQVFVGAELHQLAQQDNQRVAIGVRYSLF